MNIPCCCLQSERSITFSAKNLLLTIFTHVTLSLSLSKRSPSLFCLLICRICHSQSTQNFLVVKSVYLLLLLDLRYPRNQRRKRKRSTDESPRRIGKGNRLLLRLKGVVSEETVVLRQWGSSMQKFGFINGVDNVNWPPYRDSKS